MIYGVALLAACMFLGSFTGELLGLLTGIDKDIGGVGFAMVLLILATNSKKFTSKLPQGYEKGLNFWKEMYIPVVIAMSASQNVVGAISSGVLAIVAGLAAVALSFALIPILNKIAPEKTNTDSGSNKEVQ